mgnify:CR=1 FL=1
MQVHISRYLQRNSKIYMTYCLEPGKEIEKGFCKTRDCACRCVTARETQITRYRA